MGEDSKVLDTTTWPEDGEYGDIIRLLHKSAEIICMAAEVTDEEAKKTLFTSAKILIADCNKALDARTDTEIEDED